MDTQDILDALGFVVKYETISERQEHSCRERVVAYATIARKADNAVVTRLETLQTHLIERVVERYLDAFMQGYTYARRSSQ